MNDKKCNCCDHSMCKMGCRVTDLPMYWCPQCGGISVCEGEFATPALALSEAAEEWFATRKEITERQQLGLPPLGSLGITPEKLP